MMTIVIGGSGSGKSEYAEGVAVVPMVLLTRSDSILRRCSHLVRKPLQRLQGIMNYERTKDLLRWSST